MNTFIFQANEGSCYLLLIVTKKSQEEVLSLVYGPYDHVVPVQVCTTIPKTNTTYITKQWLYILHSTVQGI